MSAQRKSSVDRRGVKSLFIKPVPKIILDGSENNVGASSQMPHSRSAGELAMCLDFQSENGMSRQYQSSGGMSMEFRNQIDIYCSPRMHRKTFGLSNGMQDEDNTWLDPSNSQNALGVGSRLGSALSLTSEYTSRSIGLISNDSSSDSTQFTDKIEQIKQKQSLLRRYLSNPEKSNDDQEDVVQRSTKSVNNLQNKDHFDNSTISDDIDSMADIPPSATSGSDGIPMDAAEVRRQRYDSDSDSNSHLVTMVTDDMHVKEGRIRQWLTTIESQE